MGQTGEVSGRYRVLLSGNNVVAREIASEVPLGEDEGLAKACVANCDDIRMILKLSLTKRACELAPERWVGAN